MITVKCPVRISLVGGSSDLDSYIQTHNRGSVISFTPNLYTYVSIYRDKIGRNKLQQHYIVNYSEREEVKEANNIKNDIVREFFLDQKMLPCSVHMTSDVFSHGSGLAVSSSYSCSLVYAVQEFLNKHVTQFECGLIAHKLEKKINPLLGLQDVFGSCIGGFKQIIFDKNSLPIYKFLPTNFFKCFDMYLIFTGYVRSSTEVLKQVEVPSEDIFNSLVSKAETYILNEDYHSFAKIIDEGWKAKKATSKEVISNPNIQLLDQELSTIPGRVAHKLCGAGNGGFFLCIMEKNASVPSNFYPIYLTNEGVTRIL